ncbi:hypothetical protein [Flavobacterium caseinilyticum]|uniref:Carboxypeptidase-like regulatory domain-containing protein n=1 Tax=Flavobacterium caseinilyticum TaxID=2541732 RepID=A0A4R5AZK8_9FLAO|nr:hypothetical protein [Flavobacterium caseinilyticum]TDD78691.1 hypothetical protein E0F89_03410 [Flavobacterium caseinilyticum]
MIRVVYLFLALVASNVFSQEMARVQLKGKLTADVAVLEGIYVINKVTSQASVSDKNGKFSILAKVGDTLIFSERQYEEVKIVVIQGHFDQETLIVKMTPVVNRLREVIVRNGINAVSMGIIPKGQKSYTPAERRLNTATNLNASANAGSMMGGSISADPLLNWFSGRTKMLKKEVAVEKKETYLRQLEHMYTIDFFVNKLKIPTEYVKGFEYYVVENEYFVSILKSKNLPMTTFLITELATKYKEIIAIEN